jgi:hypothetical protein
MMRFSLVVAVAVVGISVGGWAQQQGNSFKVKPTREKPARSTVPPISTKTGSTASANAKALQNTEHQSVKTAGARSGAKKAPALKPVKEKSNPSINLNGSGGGNSRGPGATNKSASSFQGRLKQKGGGGNAGHQ